MDFYSFCIELVVADNQQKSLKISSGVKYILPLLFKKGESQGITEMAPTVLKQGT